MRDGWAWLQEPGKAIAFERTESGLTADVKQVRTVWQSLAAWRTDLTSAVLGVPGATIGLLMGVGAALTFDLPDALIPMVFLTVPVFGHISRSILHPVVDDSAIVVERDRVEVRQDDHVVWRTTLDRVAVDVDYDTLVLIGTDSTLRMRCRERTEDLEFLAEQIRLAAARHGSPHDVPEGLQRVQRATTARN